jgi:sorbitol-specific phosphotransferase system component IIC
MKLHEIAHSRAGDKGNLVNISVIAYRETDYPTLIELVTEDRVSELFREHITHPVTRYCVPNVFALNFVLKRPLADSVTRSLRLDAHGKSLSSLMLSMEI